MKLAWFASYTQESGNTSKVYCQIPPVRFEHLHSVISDVSDMSAILICWNVHKTLLSTVTNGLLAYLRLAYICYIDTTWPCYVRGLLIYANAPCTHVKKVSDLAILVLCCNMDEWNSIKIILPGRGNIYHFVGVELRIYGYIESTYTYEPVLTTIKRTRKFH